MKVYSLFSLAAVIAVTSAASSVQYIEHPISIYFPEHHFGLEASDVPLITSQLMGLTSERPFDWAGRGDLLHRPEGWLVVNVQSVNDQVREQLVIDNQLSAESKHAIKYDVAGVVTNDDFHPVITQIQTKFGELKSTIVRMTKNYIQTFGQLEFNANAEVEDSKTKIPQLRDELANLRRISKFLSTNGAQLKNGSPDLYVIDINGLSGSEVQAADVQELIAVLKKVGRDLSSTYAGNAVVSVVVGDGVAAGDDAPHIRHKRQADADEPEAEGVGFYTDYRGEEYTAMFGIILFLSIGLAILVFSILCTFWNMDPGKDTIIYRMTMTRAKKD